MTTTRHAYITHRGPQQWGIMVRDEQQATWLEPARWYATRDEARAALAAHQCYGCERTEEA